MAERVSPHATPVAVIGMACRFPGADNVDEFWRNLVAAIESIARARPQDTPATSGSFVAAVGRLPDIDRLDAEFFRIPPVEAIAMDPQARTLLELSAVALESAGYSGRTEYTIGVFVGSGENTYLREHLLADPAFCESLGDLRIALANETDFLASRIAFKLGLRGPSLSVQTGCSTGLTAVSVACQAIAAGDCDIAIAGAAGLLLPDVDGYLYSDGGINSVDGRCRAFDKLASGSVPASGAGVVVLKRDALARADRDYRYAVIRGWAINNDGGSRAGFTVPNVAGQEAVIRLAMRRAGVTARQVSYIEAHGTGTRLGDPIEIEALSRAFAGDDRGPRACAIGSVKTNIGHTDAAAGIAGLIKAVCAVHSATIPASLNFEEPNPDIDFESTPFYVNTRTRPWPDADAERIAGVSSFGLGGTNAHVVLAAATGTTPEPSSRTDQILVLSARRDDDLTLAKQRLAEYLDGVPDAPTFADSAFTLALARVPYDRRWTGVFASPAAAAEALRSGAGLAPADPNGSAVVEGDPAGLASMLQRARDDEPCVRAAVRELAAAFAVARQDELMAELSALAGGAFAIACCLTALASVGVRSSKLDAPAWAGPIVGWWLTGGAVSELPTAIMSAARSAPTRADRIDGVDRSAANAFVIGPEFDFRTVLARAWVAGVGVDWERYFVHEARERRPLPTYPFDRQRFWLSRPNVPGFGGTSSERLDETTTAAISRPCMDTTRPRPEGGTAATVEAVWREVLGLDSVDPDANFLELGGDSILAVEVGARINERLSVSLPLDLAFEAQTIAEMVNLVDVQREQEGTMTITHDVLVRCLDVTVRRGEEGGLLIETLVGRYTLNQHARDVWQEIDGQRTVGTIAHRLAAARGLEAGALVEPVVAVCQKLLDLRLVERV